MPRNASILSGHLWNEKEETDVSVRPLPEMLPMRGAAPSLEEHLHLEESKAPGMGFPHRP